MEDSEKGDGVWTVAKVLGTVQTDVLLMDDEVDTRGHISDVVTS